VRAANNQPVVTMVVHTYHEEDGHSNSSSSSTRLPSQYPHHFQERAGQDVNLSTIPPTPLPRHLLQMSPVRQGMDDWNSTPHQYYLHDTPERSAHGGDVLVGGENRRG